jgi:hypothetical protein
MRRLVQAAPSVNQNRRKPLLTEKRAISIITTEAHPAVKVAWQPRLLRRATAVIAGKPRLDLL